MSTAALNLTGLKVPDKVDKVRNIATKMTDNINFTTPEPPIEVITEAVDDLAAKNQDALDGGKAKKALVKLADLKLMLLMKTLLAYVQNVSGGLTAIILSSGMSVKRARTPVGLLPPPALFRCLKGRASGEIRLAHRGVKGRISYVVDINDTPGDETKWKYFAVTGKNNFTATGLISNKEYSFRVATRSTAGLGLFTDPVTFRAS